MDLHDIFEQTQAHTARAAPDAVFIEYFFNSGILADDLFDAFV
jgi:hypothetical protein